MTPLPPPMLTSPSQATRSSSSPGGVVDERVLQQRAEDEGDADAGPDVDGLRVGDRRQRVVDRSRRRRHGQQRRHRERHSGRSLGENIIKMQESI